MNPEPYLKRSRLASDVQEALASSIFDHYREFFPSCTLDQYRTAVMEGRWDRKTQIQFFLGVPNYEAEQLLAGEKPFSEQDGEASRRLAGQNKDH